MLKDRYGLEVSTASSAACDAYVDAVDRMLAADGQVDQKLAAALAADPGFALAHAALARQHQLYARGGEAREAAATAVELAADATPREQRHVEIVNALVTGQVPQSLELTKQHLAEHPRDAFVLAPACGVFGSIGFSGRIGREAEQIEFLEPLASNYGDDWWFLMVHAFALVETGEWGRGRELIERSLELRPGNAHGMHTLAHALYEAGADDEATELLSAWLPTSDPSSLMRCHNWWHYALLLMAAGDGEKAWEAIRDNCLGEDLSSPSINIFTDASSYLWRAELAGEPRDDTRWRSVKEYYEENFRRPIVFVDAHAGLAYAALGLSEELDGCIGQLEELAEAGKLPADGTAASLAKAYGAFARERWSEAIEILESTIDQVVRIGGSRAQRDLMTNTLLAAYLKADRPDDAAAFLHSVQDRQPSRPVAGLSA